MMMSSRTRHSDRSVASPLVALAVLSAHGLLAYALLAGALTSTVLSERWFGAARDGLGVPRLEVALLDESPALPDPPVAAITLPPPRPMPLQLPPPRLDLGAEIPPSESELLAARYLTQVRARIERRWWELDPSAHAAPCTVRIIQDAYGEVLSVAIAPGRGACRLPRPESDALLTAVRQSSPLPRPPAALGVGVATELELLFDPSAPPVAPIATRAAAARR